MRILTMLATQNCISKTHLLMRKIVSFILQTQLKICFLPCFQSRVWGIAYAIDNRDIDDVCAGLDHRERAGYTKKVIQFHTKTNQDQIPSEVTVYIADKNNEWFAGEASIQQIASRIAVCRGTSGSNPEYVHKLAAEMRRIAPEEDDKHLFELEMALKSIENSQNGKTNILIKYKTFLFNSCNLLLY